MVADELIPSTRIFKFDVLLWTIRIKLPYINYQAISFILLF